MKTINKKLIKDAFLKRNNLCLILDIDTGEQVELTPWGCSKPVSDCPWDWDDNRGTMPVEIIIPVKSTVCPHTGLNKLAGIPHIFGGRFTGRTRFLP